MKNYHLYCLDTETTGLNPIKNDIIEISITRVKDKVQKTWCIKPRNFETIEASALKINGHKLEDLNWSTKFGQDTYKESEAVIVDIENWLMEDGVAAENRVMLGHNIGFDLNMMKGLWQKCSSEDTFPFGRRVMDTMIMEFMMDYVSGNEAEGYSLSNLNKKYGVKNEKAHTAAADVNATLKVFEKQVEFLKSKI